MTSLDAGPLTRRSVRARRPPPSPTFVSVFWLEALREPAPNTYRGSSPERSLRSVPQKLVGSLTRPVKIEQARRPVGSGLEQGAELVGEAPFGAPRLLGGEGGVQSRRTDAGPRPRRPSRASPGRRSQISRSRCRPLSRAWPLVPLGTWLQLDGWLTSLRSSTDSEPGTAPCRRRAPCSA